MLRPDICLSTGNCNLQTLQQHLKKVQLAEIRFDLLNIPLPKLFSVFEISQNLITTFRHNGADIEYINNIYQTAIKKGTKYIDIDVNLPEVLRKNIQQLSIQNNTELILSYHNYIKTPSSIELHSIIENMKNQNPNYIKVVCMAVTRADCATVLGLYEKYSNLIAFCMGKIGSFTRIIAPLIGAPFTYASIEGCETAEGQINYKKMENILNQLKPLNNE